MNTGLKGRQVVVTGGTRGIGKAIARTFLQEGATILLTGRQPELTGWWSDHPSASYFACDFQCEASVSSFCSHLRDLDVDILINNAGVFWAADIEKIEDPQWADILHANVSVPRKLIQAVVPSMRTKRWGRIINVGSIAGMVSRPGSCPYTTSKAALAGMTMSVALDLAPDNVLVNCVCPAYTETDMLQGLPQEKKEELLAKVPLQRFAQPQDIANHVVFLSSTLNQFMTGQNVVVDGGVTIQ